MTVAADPMVRALYQRFLAHDPHARVLVERWREIVLGPGDDRASFEWLYGTRIVAGPLSLPWDVRRPPRAHLDIQPDPSPPVIPPRRTLRRMIGTDRRMLVLGLGAR